MHIVFAIIAVLVGIVTWYSRLRMLGRIGRDAKGLAERLGNAPRKFAFMRRAAHTGLKAVDDPTEAAAILLVLLSGARAIEEMSEQSRAVFIAETSSLFDLSASEADALLIHAFWMIRAVDLPLPVAKRMTKVIVQTPGIGAKELVDLDSMLVIMSEANGETELVARKLLQIYRDIAGLSV